MSRKRSRGCFTAAWRGVALFGVGEGLLGGGSVGEGGLREGWEDEVTAVFIKGTWAD